MRGNLELKVFVNDYYINGRSFNADHYEWNGGFNLYEKFRLVRGDEDIKQSPEPQSFAEMAIPFLTVKKVVRKLDKEHPSFVMASRAKRLIKSESETENPTSITFALFMDGKPVYEGKLNLSLRWQNWYWDRILSEDFELLLDNYMEYLQEQLKLHTLNIMAKISIVVNNMTDLSSETIENGVLRKKSAWDKRFERINMVRDWGFKTRLFNHAWEHGTITDQDRNELYRLSQMVKEERRGFVPPKQG